jgi:hypothetical protein
VAITSLKIKVFHIEVNLVIAGLTDADDVGVTA